MTYLLMGFGLLSSAFLDSHDIGKCRHRVFVEGLFCILAGVLLRLSIDALRRSGRREAGRRELARFVTRYNVYFLGRCDSLETSVSALEPLDYNVFDLMDLGTGILLTRQRDSFHDLVRVVLHAGHCVENDLGIPVRVHLMGNSLHDHGLDHLHESPESGLGSMFGNLRGNFLGTLSAHGQFAEIGIGKIYSPNINLNSLRGSLLREWGCRSHSRLHGKWRDRLPWELGLGRLGLGTLSQVRHIQSRLRFNALHDKSVLFVTEGVCRIFCGGSLLAFGRLRGLRRGRRVLRRLIDGRVGRRRRRHWRLSGQRLRTVRRLVAPRRVALQ